MKIKYLLLIVLLSSFYRVYPQYHLDQLSDSLKVYLEEGWKCWNETEEGSCIPYYQKFFEEVKKSSECLPCAETELARVYAWEGQYKKSIKHSQNVLRDAKKHEGRLRYELESDAYNEIGGNYREMGDLEKALDYFLKSLKVKDEIEKYDKKIAAEYRAINKYNIGGVYSSMNDCKSAIKYQKETFYELTALENNRTCQVADGISREYINCKQLDSAKTWAFKTITLAQTQKIGNQFEVSAYSLLAEIYKEQLPDSAIFYLNKALKFETSKNLALQTARIYITKAEILSAQNNYIEAQHNFTKASELLPSDAILDLSALYNAWGVAANENQDYKKASESLIKFIQLNNSINSEKTQKAVRELNIKYETEKKERQITEQELKIQKQQTKFLYAVFGSGLLVLLMGGGFILYRYIQKAKLKRLQQEKENAILNAFIKGEERERNRISHELHDGVAATIGAVKMGLESMPHLSKQSQQEQLQKLTQILENTHADVRHMAHNLLPSTLEKEGLIKATQQFAHEINQTQLLTISVLENNSQAELLSKQLQLMLFRIVQELVNNIIKHSQAQEAIITFSKTNGTLQISVTDNGIGYQENNGKGQGLYSISQRLKSIGGNFKIVKGTHTNGTQAIAELKMP